MNSKIIFTTPQEALGPPNGRTYIQSAEFVAEFSGHLLAISIKRGAISRLAQQEPDILEQVAAMRLDMDEVRTLAAFLASLPQEN